MDDLTTIEIGAALLAVWLVTLFALWKLIDRQGRPGPVKSTLVKESLMLAHMAVLITGLAMIVTGLHVFG